ncbi:CgeB family protein [Clostridium oryzae]|uniref:Spore protein YkvP n=1 Tax=Clostridium oryzae TaxID=1450648 RepID=A0A1V4I4X6_9CLOT|nr:glycosyltransferase [Clostridium oryzae]OPJ54645.1 spore protein YkvP [Clostridium oryzae]
MKVLLSCLKYDYNDKSRGYSFEYENFYMTLANIKNIDLIFFDICDFGDKLLHENKNRQLINLVEKEKPDILFNILFDDEIEKETFLYIKENTKTVLINWFCDDQWRFKSTSIKWCWCFDYCITTYAKAVNEYKKIGYNNIILSQWACNNYTYYKKNLDYKYDVSFVGQPHSNRREVINKLKDNGIDVKCFGYGWNLEAPNSSRISQDDMIDVFNSSKINLNLANSSSSDAPQQIKGRNFEVPACGGFLLTSDVEELNRYYRIGKEVVVYSSFDDMVEKIRYYLKNNIEREKIAEAGYIRTIQEHTYEKRLINIFSFAFEKGKKINKRTRELFYKYNYKKIVDTLSSVFENAKGKCIGIYGAGEHTTNLINSYKKLIGKIDFKIYYFDSNVDKWGNNYLNGIIMPPNEISNLNLDRIIISSYAHEEDIYNDLSKRKLGITIFKIYNSKNGNNMF